jgi:hypothetical protein
MKVSDHSDYYEVEITVHDVNPKAFSAIKQAVKNIWNFEQWQGESGKVFSHGIGFIDENSATRSELAEALASAIWKRTGAYHKVEVDFWRLKKLQSKTIVMDESEFVRLCLKTK